MTVVTKSFSLNTQGRDDVINVTDKVEQIIATSKITDGIVTVFVSGSTGSVTTIEYEPALVKDLQEFDQKWIPSSKEYHHDRTWGDANGFSHLRATIYGPSLTVPLASGRMTLGTWQQIVVIDHDNRPRSRQVIVSIMGE